MIYIVPEKRYKASVIAELNKTYKGEVFIMSSGKDVTHFADAANNITMLENAYSPAFAARRAKLGLTLKDSLRTKSRSGVCKVSDQ